MKKSLLILAGFVCLSQFCFAEGEVEEKAIAKKEKKENRTEVVRDHVEKEARERVEKMTEEEVLRCAREIVKKRIEEKQKARENGENAVDKEKCNGERRFKDGEFKKKRDGWKKDANVQRERRDEDGKPRVKDGEWRKKRANQDGEFAKKKKMKRDGDDSQINDGENRRKKAERMRKKRAAENSED